MTAATGWAAGAWAAHRDRLHPLRAWDRLTIRARLTLTFAGLLFVSGALLVVGMSTYQYRKIYGPLPPQDVPAQLDPDHDRIVNLTDALRDSAASHVVRDGLLTLVIVVIASAAIGWWLSGRMLGRLSEISRAARRAGETTLHERLNLQGPHDELKELGDTFDAMLERLDAAFASQRRFVANASHELRTPLTVTRAAVEVTLAKPSVREEQWRRMAEDVARSTDRAQRLIDGLLTLTRSEQRLTHTEEDDLADLAAEALDASAAAIRGRGLTVLGRLDPAPVRGDVALLSRAVANLVENAVAYNVPGGALELATRMTGDHAELTIGNDGAVLASGDLAALFEPFHRGVHTRGRGDGPGTADGRANAGLGLSIVAAVVAAHGGDVTARCRTGGGLSVTLRLPSATARRQNPPAAEPSAAVPPSAARRRPRKRSGASAGTAG